MKAGTKVQVTAVHPDSAWDRQNIERLHGKTFRLRHDAPITKASGAYRELNMGRSLFRDNTGVFCYAVKLKRCK
jgi:hypothetical protein